MESVAYQWHLDGTRLEGATKCELVRLAYLSFSAMFVYYIHQVVQFSLVYYTIPADPLESIIEIYCTYLLHQNLV